MKKFNKLTIFASMLLLAGSCAESNVEEAAVNSGADQGESVTFSVSFDESVADTRIDVSEDWNLTWTPADEENYIYDDLSIYSYELSDWGMAMFLEASDDLTSATFNYSGIEGEEVRMIYPYSSQRSDSTFDVSEQEPGLSALYMISDDVYTLGLDGSMPTVIMKHIGAAVVLNIDFRTNTENYTVKSIVVNGLNAKASVDTSKAYDDADFYTNIEAGEITITKTDDIAVVDKETAQIRFNIMPSTIAANDEVTIAYNLVGADDTEYTYVDTVTNTSESAIEFARATYNTISSTLAYITETDPDAGGDDEVYTPTVSAFTYEVTSSATNAEIVFDIDLSLCDGVAVSTDCIDTIGASEYTSYILLDLVDGYDSEYLQFATDSTPIYAYTKGELNADDYFVDVVAYKDVDGSLEAVGDVERIYFTVEGLVNVYVDITLDVELSSVTKSTIDIDVTRIDGVDSYYYGCVLASSVMSEYGGLIENWIDANYTTYTMTESITSVEVGQTYTQSISHTSALPTDGSKWGTTLSEGTEYYVFVIPVDSTTGGKGNVSYIVATTASYESASRDLVVNYSLVVTETAFTATFTSDDCTKIHAQAFTYDASEWIQSDAFESGYYSLTNNGDDTYTYTYNFSSWYTSSSTYYLYYMGFDDSGNSSLLGTYVFVPNDLMESSDDDEDDEVPVNIFTGTSYVSSIDVNWNSSTLIWSNDPSTYGYNFVDNNGDLRLYGTITGSGASYKYCCVSKEKVTVATENNIAENLTDDEVLAYASFITTYAPLMLADSDGSSFSDLGAYYNYYILVIPVDADGTYGSPAVFDIDWDYIETNKFGSY
ncbi:MAG: hypothetical protein SNI45_02680 [Rikenellaceae bacterium]